MEQLADHARVETKVTMSQANVLTVLKRVARAMGVPGGHVEETKPEWQQDTETLVTRYVFRGVEIVVGRTLDSTIFMVPPINFEDQEVDSWWLANCVHARIMQSTKKLATIEPWFDNKKVETKCNEPKRRPALLAWLCGLPATVAQKLGRGKSSE